ncbi:hypothetical protein ILYODFUR_016024, partial [Ilyodon furcidens]
WVVGKLVPISSGLWAGGWVHPGQGQSIAGQHRQDKQPCTHSFMPKGNLERPINITVMFLDCGRKLEYLERTHACTGRKCQLRAERPPAGSQTQDLLAARYQFYQQHVL